MSIPKGTNPKRILGTHLIRLRKGEEIHALPHNDYLFQAVKLKGELYSLPELVESFPAIFPDNTLPMVIEIGCYMGDTVVELARYNRNLNVLGVDIKYKRVVKSCHKIRVEKLTNAKIALCDARQLLNLIPPNSLKGVCAFFPDPWLKGNQRKHRFLDEHFFREMYNILMQTGFIWLKTDNKIYYNYILKNIANLNFSMAPRPDGYLVDDTHTTFFERLFIDQEQPIYELFLVKKQDS